MPRPTLWLLLLLTLPTGCGRDPGPIFGAGPRRIIVVSLDTLRADHLGCYGYDAPTSPRLDALAADGVRCARATAPSNWTLPSHASLFTGLLPARHGVREQRHVLGEEPAHLVETLRDDGFATAAFTGGGFLHPRHGLDRGFDHYDWQEEFEHAWDDTLDEARAWLSRRRDRDVFLFLHTFEIHVPYTAPPMYLRRFSDNHRMRFGGLAVQIQALKRKGDELRPRDIADVVARYDAGIAYADDLLGRFLDWLAAEGLDGNLLLVVTSDHGEELWEHGDHGHNDDHLGPEVTDVPLLLRLPGGAAGGTVVPDEVSFLDVMPTVLDAAGLPRPAGLDGYSLLPEIDGRPPARGEREARRRRRLTPEVGPDGPAVGFCEGPRHAAVIAPGWRLLAPLPGLEPSPPHAIWPALYDLEADPGTLDPLPATGDVAERLRAALGRFAGEETGPRHTPPTAGELDEGTRRQLEALGYL